MSLATLYKTVRMCNCVNVEIGSYDNQIELVRPEFMLGDRDPTHLWSICVDACLVVEIASLWKRGIWTTGCCCGHNKIDGMINVIEECVPSMKALGYDVQPNPHRPEAEDTFYPKSVRRL